MPRAQSQRLPQDVLNRLPTLTNHQVPEITPPNWGKVRPVPRSIAA